MITTGEYLRLVLRHGAQVARWWLWLDAQKDACARLRHSKDGRSLPAEAIFLARDGQPGMAATWPVA